MLIMSVIIRVSYCLLNYIIILVYMHMHYSKVTPMEDILTMFRGKVTKI